MLQQIQGGFSNLPPALPRSATYNITPYEERVNVNAFVELKNQEGIYKVELFSIPMNHGSENFNMLVLRVAPLKPDTPAFNQKLGDIDISSNIIGPIRTSRIN